MRILSRFSFFSSSSLPLLPRALPRFVPNNKTCFIVDDNKYLSYNLDFCTTVKMFKIFNKGRKSGSEACGNWIKSRVNDEKWSDKKEARRKAEEMYIELSTNLLKMRTYRGEGEKKGDWTIDILVSERPLSWWQAYKTKLENLTSQAKNGRYWKTKNSSILTNEST